MRRSEFFGLATGLLGLAACGTSEEAGPLNGQPVGLLEYVATAPAEWVPTPTSSTMRLAEFTTPADGGAEGGEVVAYYFGPGQGGSVEANVERWKAQFFDDAGGHPEPTLETVAGGMFPATAVTLEGAYARSVGMGGAAEDAVPDQMLIAAVVETPRGNLYVQLHGPAATVRAQREAFLGFIRTIRPHPTDATG